MTTNTLGFFFLGSLSMWLTTYLLYLFYGEISILNLVGMFFGIIIVSSVIYISEYSIKPIKEGK